jgi:hypothetical protein
MTTQDYLKSRIRDLLDEADELAADGFDPEEMSRFVRDAAAMFERFLKQARLKRPPAKLNLYDLIEALRYEGVAGTELRKLHDVRDKANEGKHDPTVLITHQDVRRTLQGAIEAIDALAAARLPDVLAPRVPQFRHRFLIAAWDHYVSNETELLVWPAVKLDSPAGRIEPAPIDSFQLIHKDEASLRSQLDSAGSRHEDVDPVTLNVLRAESDFAWAAHWEGEYRDLVAICSSVQHDLDLLPGLARADDSRSVSAALAMSAVDLDPGDGSVPNANDLLAHAATVYGIRRQSGATSRLTPAFEDFLATASKDVAHPLGGPRFLGRDSFLTDSKSAVHRSFDIGVALLQDGMMLCDLT